MRNIKSITAVICASALLLSSCGAVKEAPKQSASPGPAALSYEELYEQYSSKDVYKSSVVLSEKEQKADEKLSEYKKQFTDSYGEDNIGKLSFLTDSSIWESPLYSFLDTMPKGSDLHVHLSAGLPVREFIDFAAARDDLYVGIGEDNKYMLIFDPDGKPAADTAPLREALEKGIFTRDELTVEWTVLGGAGYENVWVWFEILFDDMAALISDTEILEDYYYAFFSHLAEHNILHSEVRHHFLSATHEDAKAEAEAVRRAYYRVRDEYPWFSVNLAGVGFKAYTVDESLAGMMLGNALYAYENVKDEYDSSNIHDFVTGIDLVNEEDASRPLSEYRGMIEEIKTGYPDLAILLHAGESIRPDAPNNILEAYLMGAKRIGHGLNLFRYPALLDAIIDADICIEVCPVSNQSLRYVSDLRTHPAVEYLKRGVPVVLSSDDPSFFEHTVLTDDFFAAAVCWDLGLAEIKQLCMNSITYSTADDVTKAEMMTNWETMWDAFIDSAADL